MMPIVATLPPPGDYFSLVKLAVMLVLITPWLLACPWVHKDTPKVRVSQPIWSATVLAVGLLGILIWLLMPMYVVGLMAYVVLVLAGLGAYVVYRNGRVAPEQRILTAEHLRGLFSHEKKTTVQITQRVKLYGADQKVCLPPDDDTPAEQREAYNHVQDLLYDLMFHRASEGDLLPTAQEGKLRFIIDGVMVEQPPLEPEQAEMIIQYLKPLAGMNAEERRRPQQGKIAVDMAGQAVDMVLTTAGTTTGQRMQFKVVQEFVQTNIEQLGVSDEILIRLKAMTKAPKGLVIIAGRSGSGVTSTLYSLLREQDAFTKQLVTLESKPVIDLENVTQNAYGQPAQLAEKLSTTLRHDPDLLMIDSCEDVQSARMIADAATRKTVILGMSASDSFSALGKWVKMCGQTESAAEVLSGVLCQVLVRKLCPTCREAYRPDPAFLAKANLPAQKIENFYRPPTEPLVDEKGRPYTCPTCQGNGYFGRIGIFELLDVTDDVRHLVARGASVSQIQAACRKNKMLYLQEQALRKVIQGVTSIQEVIRVTQQAKKA